MKIKDCGASVRYGEQAFCGSEDLHTADGLHITFQKKELPALATRYWARSFRFDGAEKSAQLSEIFDADLVVALDGPYKTPHIGFLAEKPVFLTAYHGASSDEQDYRPEKTELVPGGRYTYSASGGRSCDGYAPYFEISCGEDGVILGIGWTGQWTCSFELTEAGVAVRSGIENADLYLLPGEELRTASYLVTEYDGGSMEGHNLFRRAVKELSVFGKGGRPQTGRFSAMTWGAMPTDIMLEHIRGLREQEFGVECFFIDAGWYGHSEKYSKNEFEGDWGEHTGSWNINPFHHPDRLEQVSRAAHAAGLELLLWFEPERARKGTDWVTQYPERMLHTGADGEVDCLVDLGNEDARRMVFEMVSSTIRRLDLQCYRQDFNIQPLPYWRNNDAPGRSGITEIKYINGLYRLLDDLLEAFPRLYIDNCASGGRRNDFEMLLRAIPLWRSDYQCCFNARSDVTQAHGTGASALFPYSGTGINGSMADPYEIRSCYGTSLSAHNWWWSQENPVTATEDAENLKQCIAEYKELRRFFSCDFYPLTPYSTENTVWCVWQYHAPETQEGCVIAFRREESDLAAGCFVLHGLRQDAVYTVLCRDTGRESTLSGAALAADGLMISLPQKRSSIVYTYKKR